VSRKPKPIPLPRLADPSKQFNTIPTALLAMKKEELQKVQEKLNAVDKELERRKRRYSR
jgi:hypothetical protein